MIDIGANLSNSQFDKDVENVLRNSVVAGLTDIILTATDLKTYYKNKKIIENYSHIVNLYNTFGLHPHHANDYESFFREFDRLINDKKIISLGEFGLDYFRMISSRENQIKTMELFLHKAKSCGLPLFLHERDAHLDFVSLLENNPVDNKKVVHCFTGNITAVKKYLDLNCYIGITGWITEKKRGQDLRQALEYIPLVRLMIETDAPYLTPKNIPQKTYRNEPTFLPYVLKCIAELKNISIETLKEHTTCNTLDFFDLKAYNKDNKLKV